MASRIEAYALSVIGEPQRPGLVADSLRGFLSACAALYEFGLGAYLLAERCGVRRRTALPIPVLSVGNLTVGGTGKTPMTQWICRRLVERGLRIGILSRGHGGTATGVRVVSDGSVITTNAGDAGDEPFLLARTLAGVPVLVGKDRRLSGREALRRFGLDVLLLDDGFQYWQLKRDLDIVLLDANRPFGNGFVLPRGLLREPRRHLSRAGIVVATRSEHMLPPDRQTFATKVAALAPRAPVFFAAHCATGLVPATDGSAPDLSVDWLRGRRIVALSGIAQPQSFAALLAEAGAIVVRHLVYSDHAAYSCSDCSIAQDLLRQTGADALVMTEKDAVKWPGQADQIPTYALRIEIKIENEGELIDLICARLCRKDAA